jgi:UPF0271 protein
MRKIDLNCDMGESFGAWKMGDDARLMDLVSSVNVACGFHAGDASVIRETIETAIKKGLAVGAHPSFPDLQGFGRREMRLSAREIFDTALYQIAAVKAIAEAFGGRLHHVKPHGALYNLAARDARAAEAIAAAVKKIDPDLILYALSGSLLIAEAEKINLKTACEVFADRTYQPDGSLTPRKSPKALIKSAEIAVSQVLEMIEDKTVTAVDGTKIAVRAETVCIHGDGARAFEFAAALREQLTARKILIQTI